MCSFVLRITKRGVEKKRIVVALEGQHSRLFASFSSQRYRLRRRWAAKTAALRDDLVKKFQKRLGALLPTRISGWARDSGFYSAEGVVKEGGG